MINDQKGMIKLLYVIALLLLGVLIWGFFQNRITNLTEKSIAVDNDLSETLLALGFKNEDIVSQSRKEQKQGASVWIEYFREMRLPDTVNIKTLEEKTGLLAQKYKCTYRSTKIEGFRPILEIYFDKKLLSKLVLDARPGAKLSEKKKIAVVIDDVGYTQDLSPFLDIGIPITFAILPHERFSKTIARELSEKGMPYLLHLPLEPDAYPRIDPGKAALLVNMPDAEIEKKFLSDLASVPGVSGVSNHMGSRYSSNKEKMRVLLKLVKAKNLFYFDSYTSSSTQAGKVARELGLPFEENSIFVDLKDDKESMKKQFDYALKIVNKYGRIAVIGHISKKALPGAIKESIANFTNNGVEFVYLTDIIARAK